MGVSGAKVEQVVGFVGRFIGLTADILQW
ncbi:protein of unknown function [Candidatus Nitrospira inopinata]|uniref:Uncharacterized protein n=1 Tax=Candidatus Nitrospira inopinata TaxID=1715989 RepID=A0A0S4KSH5_9BACT|nr:protein of unknown function [Candidatus Nitrospira inopinata]